MSTASASAVASTSKASIEAPVIQLDPREERVIQLIDTFAKHLANTRNDLPAVECRVSGGWVRDKLLGLESEDLDVCISSLTGHHFATLLESYLAEQREKTNDPLLTSTSIAKIQANPDQSKHLETAKMHVLGMEMDFVQLRSEEYADSSGSSRIPTSVKFGTPLEDALRRDITINALFYNIHSRKVEDWTEKGLKDLLSDSPLIRTPLEPVQTFLDDPLRIVRCVRFASRFGFPVDASIKDAVRNEQVRTALLLKVRKERIGVELDKMLKGRDPLLALRLIDELSLYHLLVAPVSPAVEPSAPVPESAPQEAVKAGEILVSLSSQTAAEPALAKLLSPIDDKLTSKRLWLAVLLSPLRRITYTEKNRTFPLSDTIIRDSLKLPGLERAFVQRIFAASAKLSHPTLDKFQARGREKERSSIGLRLRDGDVQDLYNGLEWRTSVLFSLIMDLLPVRNTNSPEAQAVIQTYADFVHRVESLELNTRAFEKQMLDGKEIAALLQCQPGRLMSQLIQRVIEWQLDHPDASKEECGAFLKGEWESGAFSQIVQQPSANGKESSVKPAKKKRKDSN